MIEAVTTNSHRYQRWPGRLQRTSATGGWLTIVRTGIRLQYQHSHTRLLLLLSLGIVVGNCIVFYVLAMLETLTGTAQAEGFYEFVHSLLGVDLSGAARLPEFREVLWRTVFLLTIKVELFWAMIVVARVGPGLISNDLKARALPIYFARPMTPLNYVLGKWMVAAAFIGAVVLVPNLLSLIVGILLTGGLQTWGQTLGLGFDLLVSGLGVMACGGVLILALSSMTSDSRYVTVGWLAVCLLPVMAQSLINESLEASQTTGLLGSISLRTDVAVLTEWLFNMREAWAATSLPSDAYRQALGSPVEPIYPAIVLGLITVAAALFCYRRVLRFSRSAANV